MQCIKDDIERWGHGKQVMLLGDFNAHMQELDGYTDHNGTLVQSLSDELCLCIVNLRGDCVGAVTWCARGSRTCIDYALVSQGLNSSLRSVHIDEDGRYSIGSDHNRIKLVFTASTWRKTKRETRDPAGRFLPAVAYEAVTDEFENSSHRDETITYGQYVAELGLIIRKHERRVNSRGGRPRRSWWDGEVQAALEARRIANRQHRRTAKLSDDAACQAAWENYLEAKHKMQTVSAKAVSNQVRQRETEMWRMAMDTKSTLQLYRTCKTDIHREDFYDNSIGSSLLFEARAGALRTLEYRHHFDPTIASTICRACGEEDESIEHIVLRCKRLPTLPPEDATFSRTLGFRSADDATSGNGDEVLLAAVMVTKRRLSEWWTLVRR
ncbi:hypothetical protein HPB49_007349 [Dermacentor silvarum]|uniref:Uncharacterized protein n=1 Tax=Dermacentor silvarum TaxID=543639 RepID=A0ACB8CW33_DERSI|nr:hypothetical protein HPB49_007349 [Dermacentor silvarum]